MSNIAKIKGFADLYPPASTRFSFMEQTAMQVFGSYGYQELRTPILEYTELFQRSIGSQTDVVQKEMFTMADRKGRSLTMRPEATAGIMRAYIENNIHAKESISKYFVYGPMFRYERPQKGRMRQFHQLDCECLGAEEPEADAEMILMLMLFLQRIGITDISLEINTLGCPQCRPQYKEELLAHIRGLDTSKLCADCQRRLENNPLRVLDCKEPQCAQLTAQAPTLVDSTCEECAQHFSVVLGLLHAQNILYRLNPRLVRGLDYYSRTTFEVVSHSIGSQGSIAGGGRFDGLIAQLGGPNVPGIGFACGMERLALILEQQESSSPVGPDFYIACLAPQAPGVAIMLAQQLREHGFAGESSFVVKSIKSQMRQAAKTAAQFCILLGENELAGQTATIKDMHTGEQTSVPFQQLHSWVAEHATQARSSQTS